MTLTGFWNRIDAWVYSLEGRDELVLARKELNERRLQYEEALKRHRCRRMNSSRVETFRFIVSQSLKEIEARLDTINVLENIMRQPN